MYFFTTVSPDNNSELFHLQEKMSSVSTRGRIRETQGGRHQTLGLTTGNWGRFTEKTAKSWQGTGCPWGLGLLNTTWKNQVIPGCGNCSLFLFFP